MESSIGGSIEPVSDGNGKGRVICRVERYPGTKLAHGVIPKAQKMKNSLMTTTVSRSKFKIWIVRTTTMIFLWTSMVQFTTSGQIWGIYRNNGYLMVSRNGGLNQMRAAICDMVTIARYLNVTLIIPSLDKTSFWADTSDFEDIFDVDHFITSLRDQVRILKELPPRMKIRAERGMVYSLPPISWSHISYYKNQILPLIKKHKIVRLNRTDARLANNGLPLEIDRYNKGLLSWELFSDLVKKIHADRMGAQRTRRMIAGRPKNEDYFYSNPQECTHLNLEPWPPPPPPPPPSSSSSV